MREITSQITRTQGSRKLPQCLAVIIVNLTALSYGVIIGWGSPSLPQLRTEETIIGGPITDDQETWLGSMTHLSAFVISPVYSYINQHFGRKLAGYLTALPLVIAWLLVIFADSITYLYIARIAMGMSNAGVNVFTVMYIGEIAEDSIRGTLGTIRGVAADVGILFAYCVGPYVTVNQMGIVCITLPLIFLVTYYWLPESPMYLLGKERRDDALESYLWFRGGDNQLAEEELKNLSLVVQQNTNKVTLKELLSVRGTRKALLLGLVFTFCMQMSGLAPIFAYCARFFEMSGSSLSPELSSIIVGVVNLLGSIVAAIVADLAGRRVTIISTQFVQVISLGGLGVYVFLKDYGMDLSDVAVLPIVFLSVYCFCIVAGVATLGYVVVSEIFRPEARGLAMTIISSSTWIFGFLSTKFHHSLESVIELYGCFWLYAAVSLAGAIYCWIELPETKNRTLDSILRELNGDPPEHGDTVK